LVALRRASESAEGQGEIGGVLQPPPEGLWGLTPDELEQLPGHGPDVHQNRMEGREIMQKLGYGPDHRLSIKVTTRDLPVYRDPAILLIDQLKHVYIDGELELVDTGQYFPKILRKDYSVSLNLQTSGAGPTRSCRCSTPAVRASIGTATAIPRSTN
jgi:peptide/nickel transport system substrate-binding protein